MLYNTVICDECGTRVDIMDAEASYNDELDDVFFYCTKCIYDPTYSPKQETEDDTKIENDCS